MKLNKISLLFICFYLFFQNNKILEQEKRDLAQAKERAEKAEIKETLKRGEKPTYKKKCMFHNCR